MSAWGLNRDRCDQCGRFVQTSARGVSWCQTWGYGYDGTPELYDATYRCSPCTDRLGVKPTNCAGEHYNGRNAVLPSKALDRGVGGLLGPVHTPETRAEQPPSQYSRMRR